MPAPTPVVDTSGTPRARMQAAGVADVEVDDPFWSPLLDRNITQTIPSAYERLRTTGALANFARAAGAIDGDFNGRYYSDSDVYKWVESASWALAGRPDPDLEHKLADTIVLIESAQADDGYLNTYFSVDRVGQRWSDLVVMHEMYCLGHLVQAAVAHQRVTGEHRLVDVAIKACALVESRYPPGQLPGACGHPNLEMALVELYRLTGQRRWLELAGWQLDSRGRGVLDGNEYLLDHAPVRAQTYVTGHAVRALYLYAGMADVAAETDDPELAAVVDTLWNDLAQHKTSVTGGVGARWDGESFGDAFELPDRAYNETCAGIASAFLAWRLLLGSGDGRYRDAIERALYNAVLPGLAASGTEFFYQNPLADAGRHRRQPWFECACCPPNITRLLASLPGYLFGTSPDGIWIHQLIGARARLHLPDDVEVTVASSSSVLDDGGFVLTLGLDRPAQLTLRLPAPPWADAVTVTVDGRTVRPELVDGYLGLRQLWPARSRVSVRYTAPVRMLSAHPHVASAHQRVAVTRGPLVYCLEQADHPDVAIRDVRLTPTQTWSPVSHASLTAAPALATTAPVVDPPAQLYREWIGAPEPSRHAEVTLIPYFAWANRTAGPMTVFIPTLILPQARPTA